MENHTKMGRWVEDDEDIHLGGNTEIGEALRGMQATSYMGAAQKLNQLRGALGQLAGQHFNAHAPVQKTLRSPYKDSTQIGIKCTGTFTPAAWNSSSLPQVSGNTRLFQSFKPAKAIVSESLTVTFHTDSLGSVNRSAQVADAGDVILVTAFAGSYNCFPNAPNQDNGIPGSTFAFNSLGNGISWPTVNPGIDLTVAFAIEPTVLSQVTPPSGYTQDDITQIVVNVRFALLGQSLR